MSANVEAMIRAGIDAFRAGNKTDARALLERAIELDEYNEMAWLWLAAVVETPEEQRTCLENVLVINPSSERARQGLKSLGVDPDAQRPAAPSNPSAPAFSYDSADDLFGDADFSTSPGPAPTLNDGAPASEDYDSWVGGLGLGKKSASAEPEPFETSASPFGDFDFGQSAEEIFKDDELFDTSIRSVSNYKPPSIEDSGPQPAVGGYSSSYADGKSLFMDVEDDEGPGLSGNAFESLTSISAEEDLGSLFNDEGQETEAEAEADDIFAKIPSEIAASDRLPGMDESPPRAGMIVVGLLGLVNVAALIFFVFALLS